LVLLLKGCDVLFEGQYIISSMGRSGEHNHDEMYDISFAAATQVAVAPSDGLLAESGLNLLAESGAYLLQEG
jgi:hypothetical protein